GKLSFFCNSGAEAVEAALKFARKWGSVNGGRTKIVAADGAFHGRTFGALSATGQPSKKTAFEPLVPDIVHIPFGDFDALAAAVDDRCAALLLEPIQGEAGVVVPPDGYLAAARAACDEVDALLMFDEVQTGLARTGRWFAYQHEEVSPDVLCLAKALGAGLPIGACLVDRRVADAIAPGDHATTFGGGPVPCAAAIAVLDVIEKEDLVSRAATLGDVVRDVVAGVDGVAEVRGKGLLLGVVLDNDVAHQVAEAALHRGVLVNDATPNVVRIAPPLVIDESDLVSAVTIVAEAIGAVS
ncbi:MAG TPA: aspartate aminotransferase family protein, partial [Actinomycetota bacterium]|nr:aspartate aminotransferase family protein [Actinomycetota bacterium]